jgi:hypothetical protein
VSFWSSFMIWVIWVTHSFSMKVGKELESEMDWFEWSLMEFGSFVIFLFVGLFWKPVSWRKSVIHSADFSSFLLLGYMKDHLSWMQCNGITSACVEEVLIFIFGFGLDLITLHQQSIKILRYQSQILLL